MRARCACGIVIIGDRATWAIPTCVGCLPPPKPLKLAWCKSALLSLLVLVGCNVSDVANNIPLVPELGTRFECDFKVQYGYPVAVDHTDYDYRPCFHNTNEATAFQQEWVTGECAADLAAHPGYPGIGACYGQCTTNGYDLCEIN